MAEEGWEGEEEPTPDLSILWIQSGLGFEILFNMVTPLKGILFAPERGHD
jgi:hypothetical protein